MSGVDRSPAARFAWHVRRRWLLVAALAMALVIPEAAETFPINAPNARTVFGGFTLGSVRLRVTRAATLQ